MTPTLIDIAKVTNTSVSTVSRVLSGGAPAERISRETRMRVTAAASRMGYRPNLLARSLRTRKSNTVALLLSDIGNPFFGQIGSLVEQSLHRHGYSLVLCNSAEDMTREAEYLELLPRKGIDGLIIVPLSRSRKSLLEHFPEDVPIVVLDRPIPGISTSVISDQEQGTNALCDTLERVGVRRVILIAGPQFISTHHERAEIMAKRFEVVARHEGPAQRDTGRQAFVKYFNTNTRADAVVCTNNFLAQGFIDSIESIDNPPVIAYFDDIPMSYLLP